MTKDRRSIRRSTDRKATNLLAKRFTDRWMALHPDLSEGDVAFSLSFFREVYHRARLWREVEPSAGVEQQRAALERILRLAEVAFDVEARHRPALVIDQLHRHLRGTLWRGGHSSRSGPAINPPSGYVRADGGAIAKDPARFSRIRHKWDSLLEDRPEAGAPSPG